MKKPILENEVFCVYHINDSHLNDEDLKNFAVKHKEGQGLVDYLIFYSGVEEQLGLMRTYIVRDKNTNEFVGYFSLKAGMVSYHESGATNEFDTRPGVELANFAVNSFYLDKHKNLKSIGFVIFNDFVLKIVKAEAKIIGIRDLYIFALPFNSLINLYSQYGFARLSSESEDAIHKRLKPRYDKKCIFMYMNLIGNAFQ